MGLPLRWHVSISAMYNISLSPGPTLTATPLKTLPFVRLPSQPPRSNRCPSFAYRHACVGSDPAGLPSQPCIIYCCLLIPPSQPPRSKTLPFVRLQACTHRLRPSGLTIAAMYNILLSPDPTLTAAPLKPLPFVRLQACIRRLRPSGLTITAMYNILLSLGPTLTATPLKPLPFVRLPSQPCIIYCCLLVPPSQPPRSKRCPSFAYHHSMAQRRQLTEHRHDLRSHGGTRFSLVQEISDAICGRREALTPH
jgi:hypothetical protein